MAGAPACKTATRPGLPYQPESSPLPRRRPLLSQHVLPRSRCRGGGTSQFTSNMTVAALEENAPLGNRDPREERENSPQPPGQSERAPQRLPKRAAFQTARTSELDDFAYPLGRRVKTLLLKRAANGEPI